MVFKKIIFRIGMWHSRPPHLHGKNHLKFPFWLFEPLPYDSRMIWCPNPAIAFTWLSSGPFDFTLNNLFQSSFVLTKIFVIYCFCGLSFYKERKGLFFLTNLDNNWPLTTLSSLMHFKIKCYLQELIRGSKSLPHGASGPQRLRPQLGRKDFHPGPFFSQRFQL